MAKAIELKGGKQEENEKDFVSEVSEKSISRRKGSAGDGADGEMIKMNTKT